jgi:PAS domain S-box-containing protein
MANFRLTLNRKIYISFVLLIIMFSGNAFLTYWVIERSNKTNVFVFSNSAPSLQSLEALRLMVAESRMLTSNWVYFPAKSPDKIRLALIHKNLYPNLKTEINTLANQWEFKELNDTLENIVLRIDQLQLIEQQVMGLLKDFKDYEDPMTKIQSEFIVEDEISPLTNSILKSINQLIEKKRLEMITYQNKIINNNVSLRFIVIGLTILLVIIAFIISIYASLLITQPIIKIKNIINKIGLGFTTEIPKRRYKDEIYDMIQSINNLSRSLQSKAVFAEEIGKRKFTTEFKPLSEHDTLGNALLLMRDNLKKSEELLKEAQELTHNGSWEYDIQTKKLLFSEESYRILGWSPDDEDQSIRRYLKMILPEFRELHTKKIDYAIKNGVAQTYDICIQRDDGTLKNIQKIAKPIFSDNGEVIRLFGTILDIDERKIFEKELIAAKESAEQAARAKSYFLSNMSHEIRTPMNAIMGITELMLEEATSKDQKEKLKSIKLASANLLRIVNEILDFSKIEAGKITIEKIDFDLNQVIEGVIKTLSYKAVVKNIELNVDVDPLLPPLVIGDPYRLNQILLNLLGNAIKFTEKGFVKFAVKNLEQTNDHVLVKFMIIDTGIGIVKEKHDTIFESFSQAQIDHSRKYGGTGLGLSITKQLVELQGGNLELESESGKGSIFSFVINYPISQLDKVDDQALQASKDISIEGLRVLLVEDNKMNQFVAVQILKKWGLNVETAEHGIEAIEKAESESFDFILMDLQMPEMDGYQATELIRKGKTKVSDKNIPIIAVSADAFEQTKERALGLGMNAFVSKPISQNDLYKTIQIVIHNKKEHSMNQEEEKYPLNQEEPSLEYLKEITGNDENILNEILKVLIEEVPQDMARLKANCDEKNWETTGKAAHKLKSSAANIGMGNLKELFFNIEKSCRFNENINEVPGMVNTAIDALTVACDKIRKLIS